VRRRFWFVLGLGLLLAAVTALSFVRGGVEVPADAEPVPARYESLAFGVTLLFLATMVLVSMAQRVDAFALGAVIIAVLLQVILFVGWVDSPQAEGFRFFAVASGLPLVLIVVTLLFNALQREG
jgi:peptidoglycan/LPS O-acetylase OafA/YrhL